MEEAKLSVPQIFGLRVQALRHELGLTQAELAEAADLSQNFLSAIERGSKFPSSEKIASLASALKIPIYQLFLTPTEAHALPALEATKLSSFPDALSGAVRQWAIEWMQVNKKS